MFLFGCIWGCALVCFLKCLFTCGLGGVIALVGRFLFLGWLFVGVFYLLIVCLDMFTPHVVMNCLVWFGCLILTAIIVAMAYWLFAFAFIRAFVVGLRCGICCLLCLSGVGVGELCWRNLCGLWVVIMGCCI